MKTLIVMAKQPVPGRVKTRLCPPLTLPEACRLYESFLTTAFATCEGSKADAKVVAFDGHGEFTGGRLPDGFRVLPQGPGGLGSRMERLFRWSFKQGGDRTVLIGSDCPLLKTADIRAAFRLLAREDVVLSPAWDGGFSVIGLRGTFPAGLFRGVQWSKAVTLVRVLQNAKRLGMAVGLLDMRYDVDTVADLRFLALDLTMKYLRIRSIIKQGG